MALLVSLKRLRKRGKQRYRPQAVISFADGDYSIYPMSCQFFCNDQRARGKECIFNVCIYITIFYTYWWYFKDNFTTVLMDANTRKDNIYFW